MYIGAPGARLMAGHIGAVVGLITREISAMPKRPTGLSLSGKKQR